MEDLHDDFSADGSNKEGKGKQASSIFDDEYATTYITEDGKRRWRCEWCKKNFALWNATKALQHLTKQNHTDIAPCKARISEEQQQKYKEMYDRKHVVSTNKSLRNATVKRSLENMNDISASALQQTKRIKRPTSHSVEISSSGSISNSAHGQQSSDSKYTQLKIHGGKNPDAESKLTMAVADMIHSCGLPFSLASHPKFRMVISLSKCVGLNYQPPSRTQVSEKLLDLNYETYMNRSKEMLSKDIEIFGISFIGDGATVKRMPLINVLASGAYLHTGVMEIFDATSHMETGGKKDAQFIASLFRKHIDEFENMSPNCVDSCTFDGARSVQKAGEVLQAMFPRIVCTHGSEHVISLFFQDIFKNETLNFLVKFSRRLYIIFGSGCMHAPYAIFQSFSRMHNNGKNIGLIRAAETRMGGEAIALLRLLRMREPLQQTVESNEFIKLKLKVTIVYYFLLFHFHTVLTN